MAATLPSIAPSLPSFDPLKLEKYIQDEQEYVISQWLKLENDPLPGLGESSYPADDMSSDPSSPYSSPFPLSSPSSVSYLPPLPSTLDFTNVATPVAFGFSVPTSSPAATIPAATASSYSYPFYSTYPAVHYASNQASCTTQLAAAQYSSSAGMYATQYAPSFSSSQYVTPSYSSAQYMQPNQFSASTPQYTQSVAPSQLFQPQYSTASTNSANYQQSLPTQFQYVFPQQSYSGSTQMAKTQSEDLSSEDKKRKQVRPFVRRVRQTRPKVVEAKGAVQCKGRNRKKGTQCRNAALMEYIGPRPIYCAEHIELDPKSLYEKCKSSYQKDPGDNKGCKEVVLKEFGVCYKHYADLIQEMIDNREYEKTRIHADRITDLLSQLERDAAAAKKKDGDLYQRKNKLIPKFQEMKKLVSRAMESLEAFRHKDLQEVLPNQMPSHNTSILLDGMSVHIVEAFSSDEDCLSSPRSDSSLEDEFQQILA
jgi:hypothetical protein